jgi:hypothetical protein
MYAVKPTLSIRSKKSSRIPASLKKLVQGKVDGCASPSSPSSPMLGAIRSSLYYSLNRVVDLEGLPTVGASLSNISPSV